MIGSDGDVSRETLNKLQHFAGLVEKWTVKINLVSKASVSELWDRHIQDSIQLYAHAPNAAHWVDLGSGGGFPAIILALMAEQEGRDTRFTLVESDQRKCVFLRTAIRELSLSASVVNDRIESIEPLSADVLSARALADLSTLMGFASLHMSPSGTALFPKGENWREEHNAANLKWAYTYEAIPSKTNSSAAILKIKEINHV
ncbi:16S rRNA (guanine(527)-N(7))-methyltransferase RsmG [Sulfitobacter sp. BSw21498]|uniref:16S rRNA (guanine(527)-N(7))-methyltransferase RsmG n=1 Tax=Sulfitobacter sp. BSw21498 TaxID=664426 RepID=UPI00111091D3|nr:16S rRNA (guanine(527)-N(7))-methyltransferase RsmG [Sulfitobacter sp. BSw21498]